MDEARLDVHPIGNIGMRGELPLLLAFSASRYRRPYPCASCPMRGYIATIGAVRSGDRNRVEERRVQERCLVLGLPKPRQ